VLQGVDTGLQGADLAAEVALLVEDRLRHTLLEDGGPVIDGAHTQPEVDAEDQHRDGEEQSQLAHRCGVEGQHHFDTTGQRWATRK
jgi:hypothetical protein